MRRGPWPPAGCLHWTGLDWPVYANRVHLWPRQVAANSVARVSAQRRSIVAAWRRRYAGKQTEEGDETSARSYDTRPHHCSVACGPPRTATPWHVHVHVRVRVRASP